MKSSYKSCCADSGKLFRFPQYLKKMAFKFALFAAVVCIAQGFAFNPSSASRGSNECKNPAVQIPFEFGKAMNEIDVVREEVSMAAMDAYARGSNLGVVVACFREERRDYIRLGKRLSEMMRDAAQEMAGSLREKAEKYAQLMEGPMKTIAITMKELPEKVYNHIQKFEYLKAVEAMMRARKIVEENSRVLGGLMRDMASEVPEMADRAEELAKEIQETARTSSESIQQAFRKCVAEGGPQKATSDDDSDSDSSEE